VSQDDKPKDANGVVKPVGILKPQKSQDQIAFVDTEKADKQEKTNKDALLISGIRGE
jgi:hypothetical protein